MELKKGDIVWVEAPFQPQGSELQKSRPAVVLSPQELAKFAKRVIIAPCTSNIDKIYPHEVLIKAGALAKSSKISCDQIQTIALIRVRKLIGRITMGEMAQLDSALKTIFQIV